MTHDPHDPMCAIGQKCTIGSRDGFHVLYEVRQGLIACDCCDRICSCGIIAKVRADVDDMKESACVGRGGRTAMIHELEIEHQWLDRIRRGLKTCEVRKHDRDYQVVALLTGSCGCTRRRLREVQP